MANPMPSARQPIVADNGIIMPAWLTWLSRVPTSQYVPPTITWTAVAGGVGFQNGWSDFGAPYFGAAYCIDLQGFVHLRGLIKGGTLGLTAFTLPSGFRPVSSALCSATGGTITPATVQIDASGAVTPNGTNNAFITLNGIVFGTT